MKKIWQVNLIMDFPTPIYWQAILDRDYKNESHLTMKAGKREFATKRKAVVWIETMREEGAEVAPLF